MQFEELVAPENRTIFMSNNTLFYNRNGKIILDKTNFTGVCKINTGNIVTIQNSQIITVDIVSEFLEKYPSFTTIKTIDDLINFLENTISLDVYGILNITYKQRNIINGVPYLQTNSRTLKHIAASPHILTNYSDSINLIGLSYHSKIFHKF